MADGGGNAGDNGGDDADRHAQQPAHLLERMLSQAQTTDSNQISNVLDELSRRPPNLQ
jgi:hypothetical protein